MKKYKIKFKGCLVGAISKPKNYRITIEAENWNDANLKMYETHEHIFIEKVNGQPFSYNPLTGSIPQ